MEIINSSISIKRDPEQIFSTVDDEVIMLSVNEGKYFALNKVGSRVWSLIENAIEINSLIEKLTIEFDVSDSVCEKETMELLNELHKHGLIILC